jgi:hypothetical protein
MEENKKCYRFEKQLLSGNLLFDKSVCATYIIHLEDNGRLNAVKEQLKEYQPTKIVYIAYNKGYKKCNKNPKIDQPAYDLIDAYLQIFKHAEKEKYQNILILEDDFFFNVKIKDAIHQDNINTFLNSHKDTRFIYRLGCTPLLQIPYNYYNYITIAGGAHSTVYSKNFRDYVLQNVQQLDIRDWDIFLNMNFLHQYCYYIPICYQLFPKTENSMLWGNGYGKIFNELTVFITHGIINVLKLDLQPEPGYSLLYIFSKILFYLLVFLILYLALPKSIYKSIYKTLYKSIFIKK